MANSRQGLGGCAITSLFLLVLLFPVVGSVFLTFMILGDDMSLGEKMLWLVLVWLVPVIGPLLYLLIGQRRNRVLSAYA
ncbi:MAG: PLD nuclease N-terminal domain-containing protein [Ktedonobacterales bacterium]